MIFMSIFKMIGWSTIILAFILIFLTIVFYYLMQGDKNPRHVQFAKQFPGPRALPFIGNSWDFSGNGQDVMSKLWEYVEKYRSPFRLWIGSHLMIVVSESEDLDVVFGSSKLLSRPKLFKTFGDVLGRSISTELYSWVWRKDRKLIQIPLVPKALHSYVPYINKNIKVIDDKFSKYVDNDEEFDLTNYFPQLAFDIVTQSLFEMSIDEETGSSVRYATRRVTEIYFPQMLKPWTRLFFQKWINAREVSYLQSILNNFTKKVSDEKMSVMQQEAKKRKEEGKEQENGSKRMLNILYEISKQGQDMEQMNAEIIALIMGGTATVSMMLSLLFLTLAIHQDIQDKVYEEICKVFGESNRDGDENDMKKLPYLEQVIKEALRRFTVLPLLFRVVEKDCKIGKHIYPRGTGIIIFPLDTHFNTKYYKDPFKFNPDNFSPKAIKNRPRHTFLPFSAGARNCVGSPLALLEMKLVTCALLRKYKFYSSMKFEDVKLQAGFMSSNINECKVSLKSRQVK